MLNKLFSLIGVSISPSGGGVVAACSILSGTPFPPPPLAYGTWVSEQSTPSWIYIGDAEVHIGDYLVVTRADGVGGFYTVDESMTFVAYGTYLLGIDSGSYDVMIDGTYYSLGSWGTWYSSDGAGGYYQTGSGYYVSYGTYITNYNGENYYSNGSGGTYTQSDGSTGGGGTTYPPYGEFAYNDGWTYYYHDGMGGYYSNYNPPSYPPYGDYAYSEGDYTYYHDGMGGYYSVYNQPSYPSQGEFLYSDGGSSDLSWSAPDGNTGTWSYSSWGCSYYADGMGGSYSQCGGSTQQYGTTIYSGSYSYESGTDENGNPQYSSQNFQLNFDGGSGYYTNYN